MGIQIEIAHSYVDEADLFVALRSRYDLRCLPREFERDMGSVKPLGECSPADLVLFGEEFASLVTTKISACSDAPNVYHVWPNRGLCMEWDRPTLKDGACHYGRFYLPDSDPTTEESHDFLKKVMHFIIRYIKRVSPRRSTDQHPVYVGPDLSRRIEEGHVKGVAYRGGKLMTLVPNPHFRKGIGGKE